MTCIAGVVHKGIVYMAGDSMTTTGYDWFIDKTNTKVKKFTDNSIYGCSGDVRASDIVDQMELYFLDSMDERKFLVQQIIPKIMNELSEHENAKVDHNVKTQQHHMLIGVNGRLFEVGVDFSVVEYGGYWAIGSGAEIALGSLHSTRNCNNPELRLLMALKASADLNVYVRPPFKIIDTKTFEIMTLEK